jgi:hypothetical protein|tara:strand:+ start:928 stop:1125 length:198 start_codon:yes stop_codon:yes gene_type:complete
MNQVRSEFLSKVKSNQMFEIVQILDRAEQFGLMTEVVYTALKEMKSHPDSSPLLALQIAAEDWDI